MQQRTRENLRRLQKRARDKEYRLRRNGATSAQVDSASPRKSWEEVENMTPSQLGAYTKRLKAFNSRSNRLIALESGEVVPYSVIKEAKDLVRQINKDRAHMNKILRSMNEGLKPLDPLNLKEKPTTAYWAEQRVKNLRKAARRHTLKKQIKPERAAVVKMLRSFGLDAEANKIANMTGSAFLRLTRSTAYDFWNLMTLNYNPRLSRALTETDAERKARQNPDKDEMTAISGYISDALKRDKRAKSDKKKKRKKKK